MSQLEMPRILLIAGSDSSGGAGLEADQKVAAAHGCYAMTATTALTAQNTQGVHDIYEIPSEFVQKQIEACFDDINVDVIKTGMLASAKTVQVVADCVKKESMPIFVVDPVMVSTSGAQLLPPDAVSTLVSELLPLTTLLTPNVPEAELIVKESGTSSPKSTSLNDLVSLAEKVKALGPKNVLLKGGHLPLAGDQALDKPNEKTIYNILITQEGQRIIIESKFQDSKNTHGTGCSLASAIACNLASKMTFEKSVKLGLRYVEAGIRTGPNIGHGYRPLNHFHSLQIQRFAPGHFIEYLLDRDDVKGPWQRYTQHEFVKGMQDGTLPLEKFKSYLIQDYLFLIQFSRANSLAAYKAKSPDDIQKSAGIVLHIYKEMGLHIEYCAAFGLSKEDILKEDEKLACTAYTRFVLDIGQSEDWFALQMAMFPCLLGYGVIAMRLFNDPSTLRDGNRYWNWIKNYAADDFQEAVRLGRDMVERHATEQAPKRIEELVKIFIKATNLETGFWDMGLHQSDSSPGI